jgi:hypothetical protein
MRRPAAWLTGLSLTCLRMSHPVRWFPSKLRLRQNDVHADTTRADTNDFLRFTPAHYATCPYMGGLGQLISIAHVYWNTGALCQELTEYAAPLVVPF